MNYTEYFFELVDKIIEFKKDDQKIVTLGLGECYYYKLPYIYYKNQKIRNLDIKYLGGIREDSYYKRMDLIDYDDVSLSNDILILSRVGEHLVDFQHQIYDIYKSGIAGEVVLLLPTMNAISQEISRNIKNCVSNNSIDFKLRRSIIELLSISPDTIEDLHHNYTSPLMFKNLLKPIDKYIDSVAFKDCEEYINGFPHFIVHLKFVTNSIVENEKYIQDIPIGDKYVNKKDENCYYIGYEDCYTPINMHFKQALDMNAYDTIVFNRCLSRKYDFEFFLYDICSHIRPGTKLVIIEEDMQKVMHDIELMDDDTEEFWNLNSLLFGRNHQYKLNNKLNTSILYFSKQIFMTPDLLDVYMTQEGLYEKTKNDKNIDFEFSTINPYTFINTYTRT